jgi:hypothetical protein
VNDSRIYHEIVHKCKLSLNFLKNDVVLQAIGTMNILVGEGGPANIPDELRERFMAALETVIADINTLLK